MRPILIVVTRTGRPSWLTARGADEGDIVDLCEIAGVQWAPGRTAGVTVPAGSEADVMAAGEYRGWIIKQKRSNP